MWLHHLGLLRLLRLGLLRLRLRLLRRGMGLLRLRLR